MIKFRVDVCLMAACLILVSAQAGAQTAPEASGEGLWNESVAQAEMASQLTGDADRGQKLYDVCSECHFSSGAGHHDGTMPQLAGQHSSVMIKQLLDIQSGLRRNPSMYPFVARLDDPQDLADLAAYIETLPVPSDNGIGPGIDLDRGEKLYVENCATCHGDRGEGDAEIYYPMVAGQHYRYLVRQIIDIAGGRRGNANPAMAAAVANFSARDVSNVADYLSRLNSASGAGQDSTTQPDPAGSRN